MGATGWTYVVPYQTDMNKVLEDLKVQTFERGEYEHPGVGDFDWLEEMGFFEADDDEREEMIAEYGLTIVKPLLDRVGIEGFVDAVGEIAEAPLKSLDDLYLLMCFSADGTGSILDIGNVVDEKRGSGLYPLPKAKMISLLGTAEPTLETVEAFNFHGSKDRLYQRGEGFYIVTYQGGQPDKIYIEGCSGD